MRPITWKNINNAAVGNGTILMRDGTRNVNDALTSFKNVVSDIGNVQDSRQASTDARALQNYQTQIAAMNQQQQQEALSSPQFSPETIQANNQRIDPNAVRNQILQRGKDITAADDAAYAQSEKVRGRGITSNVRQQIGDTQDMYLNPNLTDNDIQAEIYKRQAGMTPEGRQQLGDAHTASMQQYRTLSADNQARADQAAISFDESNYLQDRLVETTPGVDAVAPITPTDAERKTIYDAEQEYLQAESDFAVQSDPKDTPYFQQQLTEKRNKYADLTKKYTTGSKAVAPTYETSRGLNTVTADIAALDSKYDFSEANPFNTKQNKYIQKGDMIKGTIDQWNFDGDGGDELEKELNSFLGKNKNISSGEFSALLRSIGTQVNDDGNVIFDTGSINRAYKSIQGEYKNFKSAKKVRTALVVEQQKLNKARDKGNSTYKIEQRIKNIQKQLKSQESSVAAKNLLNR